MQKTDEACARLTDIISATVSNAHIDRNGHLRYNFYVDYFERGKVSLYSRIEFDEDVLKEMGVGLFVASAKYVYLKPVKPGKKIEVRSRFLPYTSGVKIILEQEMVVDNDVVAKARLENAFINFETGQLLIHIKKLVERIKA